MPRRNEDDPEGVRLQKGIECEARFLKVATHLGYIVQDPSNDFDDENHHWDRTVIIDGQQTKVEIKGGVIKMIEDQLSILLEERSKYGNPGWTFHSHAKICAGEKEPASFVVSKMSHLKEKLFEHYDKEAPHCIHPMQGKGAKHYVKYRREGNRDSFIWVPLSEIEYDLWEFPELKEEEIRKANIGSPVFQENNERKANIGSPVFQENNERKANIGSPVFQEKENNEEMVARIRRQFRLGA